MRWLPFLSLLLALAGALPAQDGTVTVKAAIEPATAKPGDKVVLVLSASVTPGWHAYGTNEKTNIPVDLKADKLELGGLQRDGGPQVPPGERHAGAFETFPLPNQFTVTQPLQVPAGLAAGEITVSGALDYQICDANMCLPPDEAKFTAKVKIEAGAGAAGDAPGKPRTPANAPAANVQEPAPRTETKPGLRLLPDAKISVAAKFDAATARAGEVSTLVLTVKVLDEAYHAYGTLETKNGIPVRLDPQKVDAGGLELLGEADVPPGELKKGPLGDSYPLPHQFEVKQAVRVPAGTKPGGIKVDGALSVQICNANGCLPIEDVDFQATLAIEAGEARAGASKPPVATPRDPVKASTNANDDVGSSSWWTFLLACIGGGIFALVMPCTYPMIPITFSFFTKQAEKRHGRVLPLALTYAFGIVLMFVAIGAAVALASESVDDQTIIALANHWLLNTVIGIVFLVFAFSLFGWINLQPPQFLMNAAGKASSSGGYLGVFFMGATLVITSFTCTAPIVGGLLASVVTAGPVRVITGMGVFGLTMALPFLVLSLVPTKVKALPRSGEWMETVKVSLGFVELAATLKFVSLVDIALDWNALPRELFLLLVAAIFVMWAMYLFGILRKAGTANDGVGAGRMATGIGVVLLAAYMLFGALGYKLDFYMTSFAPPYSAPMVGSRVAAVDGGSNGGRASLATHTIVKDDGDRALELAKAEGKLLLYNFTGFN